MEKHTISSGKRGIVLIFRFENRVGSPDLEGAEREWNVAYTQTRLVNLRPPNQYFFPKRPTQRRKQGRAGNSARIAAIAAVGMVPAPWNSGL